MADLFGLHGDARQQYLDRGSTCQADADAMMDTMGQARELPGELRQEHRR